MTEKADKPSPGSPEAIAQGCKCPVLDNCGGKGIDGLGELYWTRMDCPVHGSAK
jgi:hypothetical protein